MKIKIIFFFISLFVLATSCGFKVLDKSQNSNFSVQEIRSSGEIRINQKIKNNILFKSKEASENQIIISLNTKKIKSIKEKNIKNEITKYKITLTCNVEFFSIRNDIKAKFSKSLSGDFIAAASYSTTINNEKKIANDLIERLSENIIDEIVKRLNDL